MSAVRESGHTPGPWTKDKRGQLCGSDGQQVGVWDAGIAWVSRDSNAEANARLIAAAPELVGTLDLQVGGLVLLRAAIEAGDQTRELLFRIDDIMREARAALAKVQP